MKLPPGYVPGVGLPKPTTSTFGERMLASMGWQKGQGLGKHGHGIKEAVQIKKKDDNKGVGANQSWDWMQRYWEQAYESAAQTIAQAGGPQAYSSGSSDSSSTCTDASSSGYSSDDSDSSSGARLAGQRTPHSRPTSQRKRAGNVGNAAAVMQASPAGAPGYQPLSNQRGTQQSGAGRQNRDGTTAYASVDELRIAAELAKDPWGRFGGKEGKMARIRRQEAELAARLGLSTGSEPTAAGHTDGQSAVAPVANKRKRSDVAADGGAQLEEGKAAKLRCSSAAKEKGKNRRKRSSEQLCTAGDGHTNVNAENGHALPVHDGGVAVQTRPKRLVLILGADTEEGRMAAPSRPSEEVAAGTWWGAKSFCWGGLLGSGLPLELQERARGFSEGDQEALYHLTHSGKAQGKQGLGGRGSKGQLRGNSWKGQKTTFSEDSDNAGAAAHFDQPASAATATAAEAAEKQARRLKQPTGNAASNKEAREASKGAPRPGDSGGVVVGAVADEAVRQRTAGHTVLPGAVQTLSKRLPGVKWKALTKQHLRKVGHKRVRLHKLVSAIRKMLSSKPQYVPVLKSASDTVLQELLLKKLRASSSLQITEKHVALV